MPNNGTKNTPSLRSNLNRTGPLGLKNKSLTPYKGVLIAAQNIYKHDLARLKIDRPVYWEDELALIKSGIFSKEQLALIHEFKKEWHTCRVSVEERLIPFWEQSQQQKESDVPRQAEATPSQSTSTESLQSWWGQQPKPKATAKGRKLRRRGSGT